MGWAHRASPFAAVMADAVATTTMLGCTSTAASAVPAQDSAGDILACAGRRALTGRGAKAS